MIEYQKMQNVWDRSETTHRLIEDGWRMPEFLYLRDTLWAATEKIDGMNIRVIVEPGHTPLFMGRTAAAQLPVPLLKALYTLFSPIAPTISAEYVKTDAVDRVILYGEGYGPGIQKGGWYRDTPGFILFDVKIGDWWLVRQDVEAFGLAFGIDVVPLVATATLPMLVSLVRAGFKSLAAKVEPKEAEGVVARPIVQLFDRRGDRIGTKIKTHDFPEWRAQ